MDEITSFLENTIKPLLCQMYYYDIVNEWLKNVILTGLFSNGHNIESAGYIMKIIFDYILINKELWRSLKFLKLSAYEISTFGRLKTIKTEYITT